MDWTERRTRFRALIEGGKCVHPGSVYDAMSARIAEDLGFEVGMFAGSTASLAVLGAPVQGLLARVIPRPRVSPAAQQELAHLEVPCPASDVKGGASVGPRAGAGGRSALVQ